MSEVNPSAPTETLSVEVPSEVAEYLKKLSSEVKMPPETLIRLILEAFYRPAPGRGPGKVTVGAWDKGIRLIIDWPDLFGLLKVPKEMLQK